MATAKRRKIPCKNNRRHGRKREKHSQVCIRPHKKKSWKRRKRRRVKSTSRTLPEPQEIKALFTARALFSQKLSPAHRARGGSVKGHLAGKNIFSKKYAKPIDNYSGIVYNKDTIKQGAKAPKGVKNEKHGKRKR